MTYRSNKTELVSRRLVIGQDFIDREYTGVNILPLPMRMKLKFDVIRKTANIIQHNTNGLFEYFIVTFSNNFETY
jgi:hypothetical protein